MKKFSLIIPTLNEQENILSLLQRIEETCNRNAMAPEVIFVDDGSVDATCEHILNYEGFLDVRLVQRKDKRGLTGAVVCGANVARHENIVVMDADLSHAPEILPHIINPLYNDEYDIVIGSRYTEGGLISNWPFKRRLTSWLGTLPARYLTGVQDPLSGYFAAKRKYIVAIDSNDQGFKVLFEILRIQGMGVQVKEVPIHFNDRQKGASKMDKTVLLSFSQQLVQASGLFFNRDVYRAMLFSGLFLMLLDMLLTSLFNLIAARSVAQLVSLFICGLLYPLLYYLTVTDDRVTVKNGTLLGNYLPLLLILPAVLFLRGGLFALLENRGPTLVEPLFLTVFTFSAWAFYVISRQQKDLGIRPPLAVTIGLLVGYSLLLHLLYQGNVSLLQEEAYYWNYAQHLSTGYLDHPPVIALLIKAGTIIGGNTEFGVRIGALFCWIITFFSAIGSPGRCMVRLLHFWPSSLSPPCRFFSALRFSWHLMLLFWHAGRQPYTSCSKQWLRGTTVHGFGPEWYLGSDCHRNIP